MTKLLEIIDKLKSIGKEIDDSQILALMLCSISKFYIGLITALEAKPEQELDPEFMKSELIKSVKGDRTIKIWETN